jgi:hypothetical protein
MLYESPEYEDDVQYYFASGILILLLSLFSSLFKKFNKYFDFFIIFFVHLPMFVEI